MQMSRQVRIWSALLALSFLAVTAVPADAGSKRWWHKHFKSHVKKYSNPKYRFKELRKFERMAVLDRETGLVWMKQMAEDAKQYPNAEWRLARNACSTLELAGRSGWRLPTQSEASAVRPLPDTGVFENVSGYVWTSAVDFTGAVVFMPSPIAVNVETGEVNENSVFDGGFTAGAWCVRGKIQGSTDY